MSDWIAPEPDEVHVVLGALADENLKRLFFSELQNPTWIAPLADLGVFDRDPDVWVDDGGALRARSWPEGEYLARVAEAEPEAVADLLLRHASSKNLWVHQVVLNATLAMPTAQAARLAPQIAKALRLGQDWVDAPRVVKLAESLAADYPRQMRRLLTGAFEPQAGAEEAGVLGTRRRIGTSIDVYWYGELASRVVPLLIRLDLDGLKVAAGWLMRAMDISYGDEAPNYYSSGHIWRPSIAPSSQNSRLDEVTDTLVDIARDVAVGVAVAERLGEVVVFLRDRERFLLSRIAVEVAAVAVVADPSPENVEIAFELLNDIALIGLDARPEYVHLAIAALPRLSADEVTRWQTTVDGTEWQGSNEVMRRIAAYAKPEGEAVTDDDLANVRRRWKYRLLLPIERVLPEAQRAELVEMKAELGEMEHPEFGSYITTSFTGPTSPVERAALAAMSVDKLRDFLASWEPSGDRHFGPSREGLAQELEAVATANPELVAAIAGELLRDGRSYVRSAVTGWAKAIENGFNPPDDVWNLLIELARLADTGEDHPEELEADDPVWRWAQRSAADFVTAYVTAAGNDLTVANGMKAWSVLLPMTDHADPTPEHEDRFGGSNMDPLTLSLNTTRPAVIRSAIKLLRSAARRGDEFADLRTQILEMLSRHIGTAADPSLAVAAVIGEALGHLSDIDSAWVGAWSVQLFTVLSADDAVRSWSDVVVSVALRSYRTGRVFLDLMRPVMLEMLSREYAMHEHTDGWRGDRPALEAAANHIVSAYVMDLIDDDDPLMLALTSSDASPSVIGDALGTLGWSIMRTRDTDNPDGGNNTIPPTVLERAKRLIDRRVEAIRAGRADPAELSGFYWWVRAEVFPPSWSMPILLLASDDPEFNPKGMLGDSLARAAESEPAIVIEVFNALMPDVGDSWKRYDLLQHAPRILAAALNGGDPVTETKAQATLDRLGREGHMTLLADVDRLMRPGSGTT